MTFSFGGRRAKSPAPQGQTWGDRPHSKRHHTGFTVQQTPSYPTVTVVPPHGVEPCPPAFQTGAHTAKPGRRQPWSRERDFNP